VAGRAPRTRFTAEMDEAIRSRLQQASGRTRRGEVRQAVAEVAAQLGVPSGAVLKRWYRLRQAPPPPPRRHPKRGAVAPSSLTALLAAYQRALAETAARRAELAQAETALSEAASQLALHLIGGG
jgi:hypothetical protein